MERRSIVLDGVRFLCAAMWSSPEGSRLSADDWYSRASAELKDIRNGCWWLDSTNKEYASALSVANGWAVPSEEARAADHGIHPVTTLCENRRALAWLSQEMAKEFSGPTVTVTHFEPLPQVGHGSTAGHDSNRVRSLLKQHPNATDLWLHGHSNTPSDLVVEAVRVFGGFSTVESTMDIGEFLQAKIHQRNVAKGHRSKTPALARAPISSPVLRIEDGLISPLSSIVKPLVTEMRRIEKDVTAILPHTMARSATLRMCVCRTIHSEVQSFKRAAHVAYLLERELYPTESNLEAAVMSARADYEPPLGYPSKDSKEIRFDYYGLVEKMGRHIEWLDELPDRAIWTLGRWVTRAYDILHDLDERGVDACVVAPPVQALRYAGLSDVIQVQLRVNEQDFDEDVATLRRRFSRDTEWPFFLHITRVDNFSWGKKRVIALSQIQEIVGRVRVSAFAN
ncbi:hypothetical protein PQR75_04665 [Paraburkholderia fungorum]|uniref:hypothetical protein n=1 Tax=Paraburkholderia fungorum TaxID=134537 RepID=UPI0038BA911C